MGGTSEGGTIGPPPTDAHTQQWQDALLRREKTARGGGEYGNASVGTFLGGGRVVAVAYAFKLLFPPLPSPHRGSGVRPLKGNPPPFCLRPPPLRCESENHLEGKEGTEGWVPPSKEREREKNPWLPPLRATF